MTKDLTAGNPVKVILNFALPIFLGMLLQQVYNLVDTMIVGKFLGADALGGVGSSGALNFLVLGFCIGLANGFGIPMANAFGARDLPQLRRFVANAVYLCVIVSVAVMAVVLVFCRDILELMHTTPANFPYAFDYIYCVFWGIPCLMLYNLTATMIRAVGDSKSPVLFLAIAAALNVVLDLLFIGVLHTGVAGAAWATNLSQGISGLLCLLYIKKKLPVLTLTKADMAPNRRDILQLLANGVPMGLQFFVTAIGSILLQSAINALGAQYVNAVATGSRLMSLLVCPFDAIGTSLATFCGQNIGAGKPERIRKGFRIVFFAAVIGTVLFFLLFWFFTPALGSLFLDASETVVIALLRQYVVSFSAFTWAVCCLCSFRAAIQGMGYSNLAILSGALEMLVQLLLSLVFIPRFGYQVVCIASPIAWTLAAGYVTPTAYWCLRQRERWTREKLQTRRI